MPDKLTEEEIDMIDLALENEIGSGDQEFREILMEKIKRLNGQ